MSALKNVPDDLSYYFEVKSEWVKLTKIVLEQEFSPSSWRHLEETLEDAKLKLKDKYFDPEFDWESDIRKADQWHRTNREWAEGVAQRLEQSARQWQTLADQSQEFAQELGLTGIRFAFLVD